MGLGIAIGATFLLRPNIIKRSVIFVEIGTVVEEIVLSAKYIVPNVVNHLMCEK